jgi:hypothetical protein
MKISLSIIAAIGALFTIISCSSPISPVNMSGSLSIAIGNKSLARTLLPDISMDPASYLVDGYGPSDASFTLTLDGQSTATAKHLAFGLWTVRVTAKTASGVDIGVGAATAVIRSNAATFLEIALVPYSGFGSVALDLNWTASDVPIPEVDASLLPAIGSPRTLQFGVSAVDGRASFSASDVPAGYYTLALKLKDSGELVMGAIEIVRVAKDAVTKGAFTFDEANNTRGTLSVNITPTLNDPYEVAIAGAAQSQCLGSTQTLLASVPNCSSNVVFIWYVNGVSQSTGSSFCFGKGAALGCYRIDVTAISADGTRAGSASRQIEIIPGTGLCVGYAANGAAAGSVPLDGTQYLLGQTVVVLGNTGQLCKPECTFAGWTSSTSEGYPGESYASGASFAIGGGNVELYAVWMPATLIFSASGNSICVTGTSSAPASGWNVGIPLGVNSIGANAFMNCSGLSAVTLPSSVTSIGNNAFENTQISSVVIPWRVTSIGSHAFQNTQLASVIIPENVSCIGEMAFVSGGMASISVDVNNLYYRSLGGALYDKAMLNLIQVPAAFSGSYSVPAGVMGLGPCAFANSRLGSVSLPSSVRSIGSSAFLQCYSLTDVNLVSGLESVGPAAFVNCSSLSALSLPASVASIGAYAFQNCSSLRGISLPSGIAAFEDGLFYGCASLSGVTIPSGVTSIGSQAFLGCSSLTELTIPASVGSIGGMAFWYCGALSNLTLLSSTPPLLSADSPAFSNTNPGLKIHVPAGSEAAYKAARGWSDYASLIVSP